MKARKLVSLMLLVVLVVSSVQVDAAYNLTVVGNDSSGRNALTYVYLEDGTLLALAHGEVLTLSEELVCTVVHRFDVGWNDPIQKKAEATYTFTLREQAPAIVTCMVLPLLNIQTQTGKQRNQQQSAKKVVLVTLPNPYGRKQIYLGGSLPAVGSQMMHLGHDVTSIDLNIDTLQEARIQHILHKADIVALTIIGSPGIPNARHHINTIRSLTQADIIVGGQAVDTLTREQFSTLFGTYAVSRTEDLATVLECEHIPNAYTLPYWPVYEAMGDERLKKYLEHEMTLVLAQGCVFSCASCAAIKGVPEFFREQTAFQADLTYLCEKARAMSIQKLEFYASSLDFFQTPKILPQYLRIIAHVQKETGVTIRIRCLATMACFLNAHAKIPQLSELLHQAGVWCIGFGVDGSDPEQWKEQKKGHNKLGNVPKAFSLCEEMNIHTEMLMIIGFKQDNTKTMLKRLCTDVWLSLSSTWKWRNCSLRPYLAKEIVPGNDGWKHDQALVEATMLNPSLFYNLDFCAFGSKLTHPNRILRWASNSAYALITGILIPIGKCCTYPLFPQGGGGITGIIARLINRIMPFDR